MLDTAAHKKVYRRSIRPEDESDNHTLNLVASSSRIDSSSGTGEALNRVRCEMSVPLFTTPLAHQLYGVLEREGFGEEGTQAYIKVLEKLAGVEARKSGRKS